MHGGIAPDDDAKCDQPTRERTRATTVIAVVRCA
jgi:hypothetical protein